jgi:hypothetical protein
MCWLDVYAAGVWRADSQDFRTHDFTIVQHAARCKHGGRCSARGEFRIRRGASANLKLRLKRVVPVKSFSLDSLHTVCCHGAHLEEGSFIHHLHKVSTIFPGLHGAPFARTDT